MKIIAYYLPQFHPIPENDVWWGEGFTEWTNVKNAIPLFKGHRQPVEPGELGYYDLRDPEVRIKQAELAGEHGIHGFCYWHYWFGNGKTLLEKPLQEVLKTGKPDFPFCLGWANESWTGIWHGSPEKTLMEQRYPGEKDIHHHFDYLLAAFLDDRYIKIDNKPFFLVYKPDNHPQLKLLTQIFHKRAIKEGFNGMHFVATNVQESWNLDEHGFSANAPSYHNGIIWQKKNGLFNRLKRKLWEDNRKDPTLPEHLYTYREASRYFLPGTNRNGTIYPTVVPNWDNSPRSGKRGVILHQSKPELYGEHLQNALAFAAKGKDNIVMLKSWNEWAEGNYLEPDKQWGRAYLETTRDTVHEFNKSL